MLGDICGRLSEGSLIAMGFCTYPKTSDGPIRIPADSFSVWQKPSLENLMSDDVDVFGWKYENVKIIESEEYSALLAETLESKPKSDLGTTVDFELSSGIYAYKRGGGKTSAYPKAKIIFEKLFQMKPYLNDAVAAKITDHFNKIYKSDYFPDGAGFAPLRERTIRTHLKRYRQELANIGNE